MCRHRVNQYLTVLNLYSILINRILVTKFINFENFKESKYDIKYVSTVKSAT